MSNKFECLLYTKGERVIYGLFPYSSVFAMRVNEKQSEYIRFVNAVYNFKKYQKNTEMFFSLIEAFKIYHGAETVVAIPSSTAGKINILQSKYGEHIRRTTSVKQRKYNHRAPISDYDKVTINTDAIKGKKIILVDDIVTTGASVMFYAGWLEILGANEVIPLGVGLNLRVADYVPSKEYFDCLMGRFSKRNQKEQLKYEEMIIQINGPDPEFDDINNADFSSEWIKEVMET